MDGNGLWVIDIQQSILFLGWKIPSALSWAGMGQGRSWIHCSVFAEALLRLTRAPWQTRLRHHLRCNSCWMIQTQPSRNDRCHLKSCYIKQRVFNCSNHLMLHTHFKRGVLGRLATCCVRGVFNSVLLIHCTTLHYKSLAELKTWEQWYRITFPYLPSTTFSTHNDGLVHRVHLLLDIPVGLLSHCKDVRF